MTSLEKRFPRYSRLMRLYPKAYRERYGREMLQTAADMMDAAPRRQDRLRLWMRLAGELPFSVARLQWQAVERGLAVDTPAYVKRNSLVAGLLLLPFFSILSANAADKLINNRTLLNSWLWHWSVLPIWILRLPELALLVAIGTALWYAWRERRLKALLRVWPLAVPGLLAVGILFLIAFHDSAQCLRNPLYVAHHFQAAVKCGAANSALHWKVFL